MRKNNSDGTFSHDPYPLITERKKFNQTETHARQLIQDESGSELNAMQAILKETQEKEAARILNEKRAKEEKIAALKKTIQAEETKSRAEIQKQLNTAAHTLNGALSTSYQSALTNQEARIKKEAVSLERKKIAAQKTFLLTETAARQGIENEGDSTITIIQNMASSAQKQEDTLRKKQNQAVLSAVEGEETRDREKVAQEILSERDTWEKSREFLMAQKRFSIQLGIFRHENETYHFNQQLYVRIQPYQSCYGNQHQNIQLAINALKQVTASDASSTAICETFCAVLLKALTDLNNTKLHSVALAFLHNYSHFITDKFSQVKHQLRDSACRQSKIEDISTIINDCITNIEFFFTTLKQLHPKNSCPVFDQTLQKNSPEGKLVNICLDLYAYVSIHLFQDQYESTKAKTYIQTLQDFQLSCNKIFSCLSQIITRSKKSVCTSDVIKADEKLYTELKAHTQEMQNLWSTIALMNMNDPNLNKNYVKYIQETIEKLFGSEKTLGLTRRR